MIDNFKIVVCASGGGGNFQALIDAQKETGFVVTGLIADRDCGAIERAKANHIPVSFHDKKALGTTFWELFVNSIPQDTDLIVLAGFMPIIPDYICDKFAGKMINTHPSLLPKYGGKGMYGVKVQEAVIAAGEEYAGCSVHFVTPDIDGGDIIAQQTIKVNPDETPWELGGRIFKMENKLLVEAVKIIMKRTHHD